ATRQVWKPALRVAQTARRQTRSAAQAATRIVLLVVLVLVTENMESVRGMGSAAASAAVRRAPAPNSAPGRQTIRSGASRRNANGEAPLAGKGVKKVSKGVSPGYCRKPYPFKQLAAVCRDLHLRSVSFAPLLQVLLRPS